MLSEGEKKEKKRNIISWESVLLLARHCDCDWELGIGRWIPLFICICVFVELCKVIYDLNVYVRVIDHEWDGYIAIFATRYNDPLGNFKRFTYDKCNEVCGQRY
jgi:hypothetical protein